MDVGERGPGEPPKADGEDDGANHGAVETGLGSLNPAISLGRPIVEIILDEVSAKPDEASDDKRDVGEADSTGAEAIDALEDKRDDA